MLGDAFPLRPHGAHLHHYSLYILQENPLGDTRLSPMPSRLYPVCNPVPLTRYDSPPGKEVSVLTHIFSEPANSRSTARQKLTRLTRQQFQELSTDVYDELMRRKNNTSDNEGLFSLPFYPFSVQFRAHSTFPTRPRRLSSKAQSSTTEARHLAHWSLQGFI